MFALKGHGKPKARGQPAGCPATTRNAPSNCGRVRRSWYISSHLPQSRSARKVTSRAAERHLPHVLTTVAAAADWPRGGTAVGTGPARNYPLMLMISGVAMRNLSPPGEPAALVSRPPFSSR